MNAESLSMYSSGYGMGHSMALIWAVAVWKTENAQVGCRIVTSKQKKKKKWIES